MGWGGAGATAGGNKHQCKAGSHEDTRGRWASKGKRAAGRRHARNKNTGLRTARAQEASPSDPARTKGWRTTRARGATNQRSMPHHGGGARTNTARPNRGGGGTHQHSTNPGQVNTTDNQHPTMPAVQRQRQQRTKKTSRALSRLQYHEPKPNGACPPPGGGWLRLSLSVGWVAVAVVLFAWPGLVVCWCVPSPCWGVPCLCVAPPLVGRVVSACSPTGGPRTNTARPPMRGAKNQHRTRHHG